MGNMFLPTNYSILDLEYTAWAGSRERDWSNKGEYREIIEIGIIAVNNDGEYDSLNILVCPRINPTLSKYIEDLTGISNKLIKTKGVDFSIAMNMLKNFSNQLNNKIFTYGDDDEVIKENLNIYSLKYNLDAFNFINIRPWIEEKLNIEKGSIDSSSLNIISGSKFNRKHRALDDCRSIFNAIKYIKSNRDKKNEK